MPSIGIDDRVAEAERFGVVHRVDRGRGDRSTNRFMVDITEPIVAAYGEIHRYVGNELIATWKLADGIADAHCVRACFDAFDSLAAEPGLCARFRHAGALVMPKGSS